MLAERIARVKAATARPPRRFRGPSIPRAASAARPGAGRSARVPVLRLVSAVITQLEERPFTDGDLVAALIDREGRWIAPAVLAGFADRVAGLATTTTTDFNILALGRDPVAIAHAVNRLLDRQGGIVLVDRGPDAASEPAIAFEHALPIGGVMSAGSLQDAAGVEREFRGLVAARGHTFHDPLFTLFFLAADFLPAVRLSPRGVWDVKQARVLWPSRRRDERSR